MRRVPDRTTSGDTPRPYPDMGTKKVLGAHEKLEDVMKWPNTPGLEPFQRAQQAHKQLRGINSTDNKRLQPQDLILVEQVDLWYRTGPFRRYADRKLARTLPQLPERLHTALTVKIAVEGTSEDTIGMVIITKEPDGKNSHTFTQLLRHPHWMGFEACLPNLRGLRVIVFQHETPDRPDAILVMDPSTMPSPSHAPFPPGQATVLRDLLAWHGGEPVWSETPLG